MPQFTLVCPGCNDRVKTIRKSAKDAGWKKCPNCNVKYQVESGNVTSRAMEVLDNGLMSKRVERVADAERLVKEQAKTDPRNSRGFLPR